jgi:hypothetical protein
LLFPHFTHHNRRGAPCPSLSGTWENTNVGQPLSTQHPTGCPILKLHAQRGVLGWDRTTPTPPQPCHPEVAVATEGSAVALSALHSSQPIGCPMSLAFGDMGKHERRSASLNPAPNGCPILKLHAQRGVLGWDRTTPTPPQPCHPEVAVATEGSAVALRDLHSSQPIGCPTLAAQLFLPLGWDRTNPHPALSF